MATHSMPASDKTVGHGPKGRALFTAAVNASVDRSSKENLSTHNQRDNLHPFQKDDMLAIRTPVQVLADRTNPLSTISRAPLTTVEAHSTEFKTTDDAPQDQEVIDACADALKGLAQACKERFDLAVSLGSSLAPLKAVLARATPTVIGILGDTGAGKSTLLNALLNEASLLPTNSMRACTAAVVELARNDSDGYTVEVSFMGRNVWLQRVAQLWAAMHDEHGRLKLERRDNMLDTRSSQGQAQSSLEAVLGRDAVRCADVSLDSLQGTESRMTALLGSKLCYEERGAASCCARISEYVDSHNSTAGLQAWPLVEICTIRHNWQALPPGVVLADLPGVADANLARGSIATGYVSKCTAVWIAADITRAVDNATAKELLTSEVQRQAAIDGHQMSITFICTKTDNISVQQTIDSLGPEELCRLAGVESDHLQELEAEVDGLREEEQQLQEDCGKLKAKVKKCETRLRRAERSAGGRGTPGSGSDDSDADADGSSNSGAGCTPPSSSKRHRTSDGHRASQSPGNSGGSPTGGLSGLQKASNALSKVKSGLKDAKARAAKAQSSLTKRQQELTTLCALARNGFATQRLQEDFRQVVEGVAASTGPLPVICVSAREARRKEQKGSRDGGAAAFGKLEHTGVPALRAHLQATVCQHRRHAAGVLAERASQTLGDALCTLQPPPGLTPEPWEQQLLQDLTRHHHTLHRYLGLATTAPEPAQMQPGTAKHQPRGDPDIIMWEDSTPARQLEATPCGQPSSVTYMTTAGPGTMASAYPPPSILRFPNFPRLESEVKQQPVAGAKAVCFQTPLQSTPAAATHGPHTGQLLLHPETLLVAPFQTPGNGTIFSAGAQPQAPAGGSTPHAAQHLPSLGSASLKAPPILPFPAMAPAWPASHAQMLPQSAHGSVSFAATPSAGNSTSMLQTPLQAAVGLERVGSCSAAPGATGALGRLASQPSVTQPVVSSRVSQFAADMFARLRTTAGAAKADASQAPAADAGTAAVPPAAPATAAAPLVAPVANQAAAAAAAAAAAPSGTPAPNNAAPSPQAAPTATAPLVKPVANQGAATAAAAPSGAPAMNHAAGAPQATQTVPPAPLATPATSAGPAAPPAGNTPACTGVTASRGKRRPAVAVAAAAAAPSTMARTPPAKRRAPGPAGLDSELTPMDEDTAGRMTPTTATRRSPRFATPNPTTAAAAPAGRASARKSPRPNPPPEAGASRDSAGAVGPAAMCLPHMHPPAAVGSAEEAAAEPRSATRRSPRLLAVPLAGGTAAAAAAAGTQGAGAGPRRSPGQTQTLLTGYMFKKPGSVNVPTALQSGQLGTGTGHAQPGTTRSTLNQAVRGGQSGQVSALTGQAQHGTAQAASVSAPLLVGQAATLPGRAGPGTTQPCPIGGQQAVPAPVSAPLLTGKVGPSGTRPATAWPKPMTKKAMAAERRAAALAAARAKQEEFEVYRRESMAWIAAQRRTPGVASTTGAEPIVESQDAKCAAASRAWLQKAIGQPDARLDPKMQASTPVAAGAASLPANPATSAQAHAAGAGMRASGTSLLPQPAATQTTLREANAGAPQAPGPAPVNRVPGAAAAAAAAHNNDRSRGSRPSRGQLLAEAAEGVKRLYEAGITFDARCNAAPGAARPAQSAAAQTTLQAAGAGAPQAPGPAPVRSVPGAAAEPSAASQRNDESLGSKLSAGQRQHEAAVTINARRQAAASGTAVPEAPAPATAAVPRKIDEPHDSKPSAGQRQYEAALAASKRHQAAAATSARPAAAAPAAAGSLGTGAGSQKTAVPAAAPSTAGSQGTVPPAATPAVKGVPVVCNRLQGVLVESRPGHYAVHVKDEHGRLSIMKPPQFETEAGRGSSRKWKESVRVDRGSAGRPAPGSPVGKVLDKFGMYASATIAV